MALLNYRSPTELNDRFERSWQSGLSPLGGGGRFAVESYLDFHGNKFTRRFDANSYLMLVEAMNSHDIGRDRGGVGRPPSRGPRRGRWCSASTATGCSRSRTSRSSPATCRATSTATLPVVIASPFGHDGFLIEDALVAAQLRRLLAA